MPIETVPYADGEWPKIKGLSRKVELLKAVTCRRGGVGTDA